VVCVVCGMWYVCVWYVVHVVYVCMCVCVYVCVCVCLCVCVCMYSTDSRVAEYAAFLATP